MNDIKTIGLQCKEFREKIGYTQFDVAKELDCSKENISAFETGRNNSAIIYNWYIEKGLFLETSGLSKFEISLSPIKGV